MSFCLGFSKVASEGGVIGAVSALGRGLREGGKMSVGDALKLKGLVGFTEATGRHGGLMSAIKSEAGRQALVEALGKAAPSIGAAGLYGGLAHKAYKKYVSADPYSQYYGY